MGFMDRAKEAAEDLKASFATNEVRDSEQAYRDLGMLAYLTTTGRPIDEADRQRLVNLLYAQEQRGALPAFRLVTAPPPPPPPPPPATAATRAGHTSAAAPASSGSGAPAADGPAGATTRGRRTARPDGSASAARRAAGDRDPGAADRA